MKRWAVAAACALALGAAWAEEAEPLPASVSVPVSAPVSAPADVHAEVEVETHKEVGRGLASWYGPRFHGRKTASGERFNQHELTAAHRTLPFGTVVRVQSLVNGRTIDVRINDRGPHIRRRIIDLSRGAAEALGLLEARTGIKPVVISVPQRRD